MQWNIYIPLWNAMSFINCNKSQINLKERALEDISPWWRYCFLWGHQNYELYNVHYRNSSNTFDNCISYVI